MPIPPSYNGSNDEDGDENENEDEQDDEDTKQIKLPAPNNSGTRTRTVTTKGSTSANSSALSSGRSPLTTPQYGSEDEEDDAGEDDKDTSGTKFNCRVCGYSTYIEYPQRTTSQFCRGECEKVTRFKAEDW